jgi:hypothetical protein
VPWRLIGTSVTVEMSAGMVRVFQGGLEVARHEQASGRRQRVLDPGHLAGIVGCPVGAHDPVPPGRYEAAALEPELLRPLTEYEAVIGGGW